jgi:HSP20 family molecular chaperone IbpA
MTMRTIPVEEAVYPGLYRLRAELPGIDPVYDLRVTCEGSELRLDAAREPSTPAARGHSEFWYGRRLRVVTVPPDVRLSTVTARYADGVLEVSADRGVAEPRRAAFPVRVDAAVQP